MGNCTGKKSSSEDVSSSMDGRGDGQAEKDEEEEAKTRLSTSYDEIKANPHRLRPTMVTYGSSQEFSFFNRENSSKKGTKFGDKYICTETVLGKGSSGIVFEGHQLRKPKELVAVKIIHKQSNEI